METFNQKVRSLLQWPLEELLALIARAVLYKYKPTVIAVTGNVGKTTTKDVIASMIASHTTVRSTIRSQNSDLTTPLSVFGREIQSKVRNPLVWLGHIWFGISLVLFKKDFPKVLVIEISAVGPGDITRQVKWLKPHIAVLTALQAIPVHVEFFKDREELFNEKMQLAVGVRDGGPVIYNNIDEFLPVLMPDYTTHGFPVGEGSSLTFDNSIFVKEGVQAQVHLKDETYSVLVPGVWGNTYMISVLLGVQVVKQLGFDITKSLDYFGENFVPTAGRMRILRGKNQSTIIDDSYSASPIAVRAALDTLQLVQASGRKIFIFGNMEELGDYTETAHQEIGRLSADIVDLFITVGAKAKIASGAAQAYGLSSDKVKHFKTSDGAGKWLEQELQAGDYVLTKSSRHAIKMEQALRYLVDESEIKNLCQEYL